MDKTIFQILQEVDEDIRIYEKYGKRVRRYLSFLPYAVRSGLSPYEIQKCFDAAPEKIGKLMVTTNRVNMWLEVVSSYMNTDMRPSKAITARQIVCAYMIYRKAKRLQAREEYGWYGGRSYPWSISDGLYYCKCGNKRPYMYKKGMYKEGVLYRAVCYRCFRHTKKGNYQQVVEEWNTKIGIDYRTVVAAWEEL